MLFYPPPPKQQQHSGYGVQRLKGLQWISKISRDFHRLAEDFQRISLASILKGS